MFVNLPVGNTAAVFEDLIPGRLPPKRAAWLGESDAGGDCREQIRDQRVDRRFRVIVRITSASGRSRPVRAKLTGLILLDQLEQKLVGFSEAGRLLERLEHLAPGLSGACRPAAASSARW